MKTKKNAGFSLVELIVVIAIMAVLVGVLAPAYLKYVEKSRKSSDITAIDEVLKAADAIASDAQYDFDTSTSFVISVTNGKLTLSGANEATASADGIGIVLAADDESASEALKAWKEDSSVGEGYSIKSKDWKDKSGTATGAFSSNGTITWTATGDFFTQATTYSKELGKKITVKASE